MNERCEVCRRELVDRHPTLGWLDEWDLDPLVASYCPNGPREKHYTLSDLPPITSRRALEAWLDT